MTILSRSRELAEAFAEAFATTFPGCPAEGNLFHDQITARIGELEAEGWNHDELYELQTHATEVAAQLYQVHVRNGRLESLLDLAVETGVEVLLTRPTDEQAVHVPAWAEARGYTAENLEHHFADGKVINVVRVRIAHRHVVTLHLPLRGAWPQNLLAAIGEPAVDQQTAVTR